MLSLFSALILACNCNPPRLPPAPRDTSYSARAAYDTSMRRYQEELHDYYECLAQLEGQRRQKESHRRAMESQHQ